MSCTLSLPDRYLLHTHFPNESFSSPLLGSSMAFVTQGRESTPQYYDSCHVCSHICKFFPSDLAPGFSTGQNSNMHEKMLPHLSATVLAWLVYVIIQFRRLIRVKNGNERFFGVVPFPSSQRFFFNLIQLANRITPATSFMQCTSNVSGNTALLRNVAISFSSTLGVGSVGRATGLGP